MRATGHIGTPQGNAVGGAINNFTVEALRDLARRRTPRVAFDYLDGGAGDESALRLNLESFTKLKTWFQLYVGSNPEIVDDLIDRAADAGCSVLVVTADVAAPGKRIRDLVNGFTLPLKPTVRGTIDSRDIHDGVWPL